MKRYFAFILSGCVAANATALSLQDALDMAMANNSKIKAEKAKVDIAQSGEDEAFARFLPTV
ncbi:MAG: TolC family protein, partial [Fibrobacter sp.]|nr:TolC family protein [Fibrobacter sp.]